MGSGEQEEGQLRLRGAGKKAEPVSGRPGELDLPPSLFSLLSTRFSLPPPSTPCRARSVLHHTFLSPFHRDAKPVAKSAQL